MSDEVEPEGGDLQSWDVRELAKLLGKRATLTTREGLEIAVKVVDVRQSYGRSEAMVTPVNGKGEAWVTVDRIKVH